MVQPIVVEVREQQEVYYHWEGKLRRHFLDLLVYFQSGKRVAYSIKYLKDVEKSDLKSELKAINDHNRDTVADDYRVLTEANVNLLEFENAKQIISCAKDHDFKARKIVKSYLPKLGSSVTPREIGLITGLGRRGERAAIALLQSGVFKLTEHTPIHQDVQFTVCGKYEN